jgi:hypothetical protein
MAFMKTSIAFQKPRIGSPEPALKVGDRKEGQVWDGEKWVPEKEWNAKQADSQEVNDG